MIEVIVLRNGHRVWVAEADDEAAAVYAGQVGHDESLVDGLVNRMQVAFLVGGKLAIQVEGRPQ